MTDGCYLCGTRCTCAEGMKVTEKSPAHTLLRELLDRDMIVTETPDERALLAQIKRMVE